MMIGSLYMMEHIFIPLSLQKNGLEAFNMDIFLRLSHNPALNPIDTVWGLLAQRVYPNNRQFSIV